MKESDLFVPVKEWLEEKGYEVFSEVQHGWGGKRADVVGRIGKCICIVEMKTSLSMDVIEQAISWTPYAHYIYIAIPKRKAPIRHFIQQLLRQHRIGILEVSSRNWVSDYHKAHFNRPSMLDWTSGSKRFNWNNILKEEHKTWLPGGSAGGGYVTDYKITIQSVKDYLRRQKDWVSINDILTHCETHYASPKPSLAQALINFENDWCEVKKIGRKNHYRMKEDARLVMHPRHKNIRT
ncbi:hypothetical protein AAXE64_27930 [Priestia megaterium]